MTPVQFLARLASLIPPPRFPLQRFSGVLAPNSSWRAAVVAMRPAEASGVEPRPSTRPKKKSKKDAAAAAVFLSPANDTLAAPLIPAGAGPRTSLGAGLATLGSGRMDWASLLRRVYPDDVLGCPCGGRRRIVADITEPEAIAAILGHLGLPLEAPPIARARDPSDHAA